jgi:hypothetical protein
MSTVVLISSFFIRFYAAEEGEIEGRVKENYILKGCHVEILSLLIICGSIAGTPAICKGYKI